MNVFRISLAVVVVFGLFALASCSQDELISDTQNLEEEQQAEFLSEEEAVKIISESLTTETEGMTAETNEVVAISVAYAKSLNCGDSGDTTFVRTHNGPNIVASFTIHRSWGLICENGQPAVLQLLREVEGGYETATVQVEGSSVTALDITHLLSPNFVIVNGTRDVQRTRTSLENSDTYTDVAISMTFINVKVARTPYHQILEGEVTFSIELVHSNGVSHTFEGNLIFLGNQTALLTINGHSRVISW